MSDKTHSRCSNFCFYDVEFMYYFPKFMDYIFIYYKNIMFNMLIINRSKCLGLRGLG